MLQKVHIILDSSNIDKEINELKLSLVGDNLMQHKVVEEGDYTVILLENSDRISDEKYIFYGREISGKLYIARMQHILPIEASEPDFYDQFFALGAELKFL
jgi:hypothetical protein